MQPIDIVERVKTTYKSYIKTAFPVIDEGLRAQMHACIDQANLLWQESILSSLRLSVMLKYVEWLYLMRLFSPSQALPSFRAQAEPGREGVEFCF
jgi:hypothetical protein